MACLSNQVVYGQTNANIFFGMAVFDALSFNPLQCAVRAIIDMDNDFVIGMRMLADTVNAKLRLFQVGMMTLNIQGLQLEQGQQVETVGRAIACSHSVGEWQIVQALYQPLK
jgi:hypothetical protein